MYHFELQYSDEGAFVGARVWAYYEPKAEGKYISKEKLYSMWRCDYPNLSDYVPDITRGTKLIVGPIIKSQMKIERNKGNQCLDKSAKEVKAAEQKQKGDDEASEARAEAAEHTASFSVFFL